MAQNLLEELRSYTTLVADTGEIVAMEKFRPQDATTNPSLITTAAQMPQYQQIMDDVLIEARKELGEGAGDQAVANLVGLGEEEARVDLDDAHVERLRRDQVHQHAGGTLPRAREHHATGESLDCLEQDLSGSRVGELLGERVDLGSGQRCSDARHAPTVPDPPYEA